MNARNLFVAAMTSAAVAGSASTAAAQVLHWIADTADWNVDANWNTGLTPIAGESPHISNSGTAQLLSGTTPLFASVYVASGLATTGRIEVLGGTLNSGRFLQIGATGIGSALFQNCIVNCDNSIFVSANYIFARGHLDIRAGAVVNTLKLNTGDVGEGTVNHNLGEVVCTESFNIARNSGSIGLYELEDGGVTTLNMNVGYSGFGTLHQSGGVFVCSETAIIGKNSDSTGIMTISGGSASFDDLFVGLFGSGVYRQQLGAVTVSGALMIGCCSPTATGTYKLEGGQLTASNVIQGTGVSAFEMTGGRFVWNFFGKNTAPFDLSPTGGVIAPKDTLEGIANVRGNFSLGLGATYEADIHGTTPTTNQDQIDVNGMVSLAGTLDFQLSYSPSPGHQYRIIDNDDADPVAGAFAGLPEGECFDAFFPPLVPHRMIITYAGGTGNDVVVTNMGCPVDFNMDGVYNFFDVSMFLVGYTAMQPCFDLNNDGLWDFFDVSIFLTEYTAGCP